MRERGVSRRGGNDPGRESFLQPPDLEDLLGGWLTRSSESRAWMPAIDIEETDDAYMVTAELPGLKKDEVDITVENNVLTLSGERRWEKDEGAEGGGRNRQMHRVERGYGRFIRSFALPRPVDAEKVQARFADGELHITIPKDERTRPRRVNIT